jgi:hypothetical protein
MIKTSFALGLIKGYVGSLIRQQKRWADQEEKKCLQQEFLNLILERGETGDNTKLIAWWRKHFPGYKWWLLGPAFQIVVPDVPEMGNENGKQA